jgi:hypothetical protein
MIQHDFLLQDYYNNNGMIWQMMLSHFIIIGRFVGVTSTVMSNKMKKRDKTFRLRFYKLIDTIFNFIVMLFIQYKLPNLNMLFIEYKLSMDYKFFVGNFLGCTPVNQCTTSPTLHTPKPHISSLKTPKPKPKI